MTATVIPLRRVRQRHSEHVFCPLFIQGHVICVCQGNYGRPYGVSAR